jgi:hypothetical protein
MNAFVCLFIVVPQIRSEKQNKETREIPQDGITSVALGFDLAKTIWKSVTVLQHIKYLQSPCRYLKDSRVVLSNLREEGAGPF